MRWRIYYDDGSVCDDTMGSPEDAPPYGVLHISFYDEENRRLIVSKFGLYYFKHNQWWGSDMAGMIDQFATFPNDCRALKMGRTVMNDVFISSQIKAQSDTDFPKHRDTFISEPTEVR